VREPAAAERIAFLAGEMDRWRNTTDLSLKNYSFPDHYIDMEELAEYGLKAEMLPIFRYDFVAQLALFRKAHPDKFPEPDAASNQDHTRGTRRAPAVGHRGIGQASSSPTSPTSKPMKRAARRRKSPTPRQTSSTSWG
jgi:hypothetical protein